MIPIRLCKTTLQQEDGGVAPIVQVQYLSQIKNAVNASPYGIHSSPVLNSPCLVITINNDPANAYILPLSFVERKNIDELKEGEVAIGNFTKKANILFDETGNISLSTQENLTATVEKDVELNANGNLDADIGGTSDINSTGDVTVDAPNININGTTNINGNTFVTGTLGNSSILTAGNGATGTFLNSVTVLNGIVTGGS